MLEGEARQWQCSEQEGTVGKPDLSIVSAPAPFCCRESLCVPTLLPALLSQGWRKPQPHHTALTFIVLLILNVPGEPKVSQLHTFWGGHQDVPHSNIPARRETLGWGEGMEKGWRRRAHTWTTNSPGFKKGLQQRVLPASASACSCCPPACPPWLLPSLLFQHPAQLLFPPALPVHTVDGFQVGQSFADLQRVEDEHGHSEAVLVLLQVLPQLQQDKQQGLSRGRKGGRGTGWAPVAEPHSPPHRDRAP